jgi:hypothetical protein
MQEAELEVPFAMLFGKALIDLPLTGDAGADRLGCRALSPYAEVAKRPCRLR